MNFPAICITCQINLRDTLRPLPGKPGFYYCTRCEACYQYMLIKDMFGKPTEYLDPVKPGKESWLRAADDGVQYVGDYEEGQDYEEVQDYTSNHTMPPEYNPKTGNTTYHLQVPKISHYAIPDFEEERDIIKKSKTVKEFLKNSLYLEKPYDKD